MFSARSLVLSALCAFAVFALAPAAAPAQTIDLSLNVFYNTTGNTASGGKWELVAKTSSPAGIAGVDAQITNVLGAVNRAPRATVNGNDPAGFSVFADVAFPTYHDIIIGQAPLGPLGPSEEQSLFYGVGNVANGAPNYPQKPPGTTAVGPAFTSLTAPVNIPWASNVLLNTGDWANAARLASGTFAVGVTPAFVVNGSSGQVFSSIPNTNNTFTDIIAATVSTTVRIGVAGIPGDYNNNGAVDAADYVVWRNLLNTNVTAGTAPDGSGNGIVDQADYDFWRARFGNTSGSGSGGDLSTVPVPEPARAMLIIFGLAFLASHRTRTTTPR